MIKKTHIKYFLPLSLMLSSPVLAKNTIEMCEMNMTTTADISQCLDGIKAKKDRELQTWVNNQSFILQELSADTGRHAALNMFKRSQRNFISYRENNCRWQYLAVSPGTGAAAAFKKCFIMLTQDRIDELASLSK
ncbi:lysozyme inhibitor LprI family protein [Cognaticolwellia mytili]|uniref:lysozyme inhibitor LprI family protein n=1 Tax=Cognaticolwellia mytili TaxID=1888913 RepID=UPI00117EF5EA|nr:lysozyme inhibitor LprI family protein [Cognaticolwellia mytili]